VRRVVAVLALGALAAAAVAAARRRTHETQRGDEGANGHRAGDSQESLRRFVEAGERRREPPSTA
jgi:hypothetical protein